MQCSSCSFQLLPETGICPRCGQKQTFTLVSLSSPATSDITSPYPAMQSPYHTPARPRVLSPTKLRPLSSSISTQSSQFHIPARPRVLSSTEVKPASPLTPIPSSQPLMPVEANLSLPTKVKSAPSFTSKLRPQEAQSQASTASLLGTSPSIPSHTSQASITQDMTESQEQSSTPKALKRPGVVTTIQTDFSHPQRTRKLLLITASSLVGILLLSLGGYAIFQFRGQNIATPTSVQSVYPIATLPPIIATDPHNLYTQATSRTPIFTDSLQLQTANQWQSANTPDMCNLQADALHTFSPDGSKAAECVLEATKFTNFAFQVQVSIVQGNTAGLVFRADSLGHQQYLLGITTSGSYMLALTTKSSGSQPHVLASGVSSVINQGLNHFNQLTIIARNSTLYLYINGQFITQVNDGTYSSGSIGLFSADPHGTATEGTFDYLCIWSV